MGPKKARKKVGKIEVPTDTPTELKLGITAADIQRRRHEREQRKWEEAEKQQREERKREEARRVETPESTEEAVAKKDQELRRVKVKWTQRMEERPAHLNHNPGAQEGHMTNIYLTDSAEEAIVDLVKDHVELYTQTND